MKNLDESVDQENNMNQSIFFAFEIPLFLTVKSAQAKQHFFIFNN